MNIKMIAKAKALIVRQCPLELCYQYSSTPVVPMCFYNARTTVLIALRLAGDEDKSTR